MTQILAFAAQFIFILLIAPFASGLVRFLKARMQGRKGPSPFLPYAAWATMLKKEMVIPSASSWIFRIAPFAVLASSLGLALVIPTVYQGGIAANLSDFLIVAGILMTGSIFLVLGGLDTGSAFGGMGSSREMTLAAILEPTVIMIFATYSYMTGSFTIDGMMAKSLIFANPFLFLTLFALVMLALAENARYPVDNPATHLELTMIHEAMILEYSGPYLAMMEYASALKLTIFAFLISNFLFPASLVAANAGALALLSGLVFAIVKVIIVMSLLAFLESTIVKMRFYRMQEYVTVSFFAAFFGLATAILARRLNAAVSYHTFFAMLSVFFTVFMFGSLRIRPILRYYVFSSLAIAGVAFSLGWLDREGAWHMIFFGVATIIVKAVLAPFFITYVARRYKAIGQMQTFLKPASSYFLAGLIMIVSFFAINHTPLINMVKLPSLLFASIALVIFGVMKMVVRRNVFSQIVGLLVLENGLALFTLVTIKTLPIVVELGIFAITLISVAILSRLSTNIKELYGSTDTEELRKLVD